MKLIHSIFNIEAIDLTTFLGVTGAFTFIGMAVYISGSPYAFFDVPALLIVILGTFSITTACFTIKEIVYAQRIMFKTIFYRIEDPLEAARSALDLSTFAYRRGLIKLGDHLYMAKHNQLLYEGITLASDNIPPTTIEKILMQKLHAMEERHAKSVSILRKAGEISPAMGLIGTLIGLVQMLGSLDDISKVGPSMAVALLTTFYGAILSYVIFYPLASKLERNTTEELLTARIYLKSVISIAHKENPRHLEILINSLLPESKHIQYFNEN